MVYVVKQGWIRDAERTPVDRVVEYSGSQGSRSIGLAGDRLVEVTADPNWDGFSAAADLLHAKRPVQAWRVDMFAETGRLSVEDQVPAGTDVGGAEMICQCCQVPRSRITDLLAQGCSISAIAESTGASTVCGGCRPLVEGIAGKTTMQPARLIAREQLDTKHGRFTFQVEQAVANAPPGAHVMVQLEIDGRRISRNYTLTGSDPASRTREIIVRRESHGVFSRWLHDYADDGARLSMSAPIAGDAVDPDHPLIFIAGGIGITPALSRLKAMASTGRGRMRLHWSARFEEGAKHTAEVLRLVDAAPGAEAVLLDTSRKPRMTAKDWGDFAPVNKGSTVHVCGPARFMDDVAEALADAGWPRKRIRLESFGFGPGRRPLRRIPQFNTAVEPVLAESFRLRPAASVLHEAGAFLRQFYFEHGAQKAFETRMSEVEAELLATGSYVHTHDELAYGARLAWRNSTRCIGRVFWQTLTVFDKRHLDSERDIFGAILHHLRFCSNDGDLLPTITVFRPGEPRIRILNREMILYAGYEQADGKVLGDPKNFEFTSLCLSLGWQSRRTPFDLLPILIRIGDRPIQVFNLPEDNIIQVRLEHPEDPGFAGLGLKWFAVPVISDMALDLGGIQYSAAPFNGFYMGTEIGSMNLADPRRYNKLLAVAERMHLNIGDENPLWRDQALVEINRAVIHSFRRAGVRILDHHALSGLFMRFKAEEEKSGRPLYAHWPWIVPPMSSNLSEIWHDTSLKKVILKPNYFYQSGEPA